MKRKRYAWIVLNQSQSPAFQEMIARLADQLGPCLLITGTPYPSRSTHLDVERAPPYERAGMARRAVSWLRFTAWALTRTASLPGKPFIFAVTNPPLLPGLAWALRARARPVAGSGYGLLVWDVYPDAIIKMGWTAPNGALARGWRALSRRALLGADTVITLGPSLARALTAHLDGAQRPLGIEVISSWVDHGAIKPIPKSENAFAASHGQVGRITVLYSGNMGASHGVEVLPAVAELLSDRKDVAFLLIGDGLGRDKIAADAVRRRLDNLTLLEPQPWETLPFSLATGDIGVVSQASGVEDVSVPSKTYSLLAAGCAILALTSEASDLGQLVRAFDAGIVVSDREPGAIAAAVRRLVDDPERLKRCRSNARRAAVEQFSAESTFTRFRDALSPHILCEARS